MSSSTDLPTESSKRRHIEQKNNPPPPPPPLSISIRLMDDKVLVFTVNGDSTVASLVSRLINIETCLVDANVKLFFNGNEQKREKIVEQCKILSESIIHVVDLEYVDAYMTMWRELREMVIAAGNLCKGKPTLCKLKSKMTYFLEELRTSGIENLSIKHLYTFTSLSVPEAIFDLYCKPNREISNIGAGLIKQFITGVHRYLTTRLTAYALHPLIQFCAHLRTNDIRDQKYMDCRRTLCNKINVIFSLDPGHSIRTRLVSFENIFF